MKNLQTTRKVLIYILSHQFVHLQIIDAETKQQIPLSSCHSQQFMPGLLTHFQSVMYQLFLSFVKAKTICSLAVIQSELARSSLHVVGGFSSLYSSIYCLCALVSKLKSHLFCKFTLNFQCCCYVGDLKLALSSFKHFFVFFMNSFVVTFHLLRKSQHFLVKVKLPTDKMDACKTLITIKMVAFHVL